MIRVLSLYFLNKLILGKKHIFMMDTTITFINYTLETYKVLVTIVSVSTNSSQYMYLTNVVGIGNIGFYLKHVIIVS